MLKSVSHPPRYCERMALVVDSTDTATLQGFVADHAGGMR